ncbi:MAG: XRE family transcriptional regulator [Verrucomicrobiaceae bacterium]|nr:MAG: XRE family transcriptional regulator [Verrucomicrobiaceae bacterium]
MNEDDIHLARDSQEGDVGTRPREAAKLGYGRGWELYEIRQTGVQSTLDENGRPSVRLAHRRELGPGASMGDIATRVKRARMAAGLTQAQLAIATGVKRTAVVQWESLNGTNPTPEHMATIAIRLGCCLSGLRRGGGPPQRKANSWPRHFSALLRPPWRARCWMR